MLVLSREPGESIHIGSDNDECLITVQRVSGQNVNLLINFTWKGRPAELATTAELARDAVFKISDDIEITVVEFREDKVRIAVNAPKTSSIHRLEVYEAIKRFKRPNQGGDPDDGLAGSRVPRPGGPKPPSLDVRLDEPPPEVK